MKSLSIIAVVAGLTLAGCEDYYDEPQTAADYAPVSDTTVAQNTEQQPQTVVPRPGGDAAAADILIPRDNPRGDLRVASYGIVDIGPQVSGQQQQQEQQAQPQAQRIQAIHVRMKLTNNSDRPWTLDTREQKIDLEGYGTSVPAFATAETGVQPPVITVDPGQARTVDLFFPLPKDLQNSQDLPSYDALTRVHAGDQIVDERVTMNQMAVEAPPPAVAATPDYGGGYYYWGPSVWYNPYWADYGFIGGVYLPPFYFGFPLYSHYYGYYGRNFYGPGYYGRGYYGRGYYYGRPYPYGGGYYRGYPRGGYYGGYPRGYYGNPRGGYYGNPRGYYGNPRGGYYGNPNSPSYGTPRAAPPRGGYYGAPRGGAPYGGYRGNPSVAPHGYRPPATSMPRGAPGGGYRGAPSGGFRGSPGGGYHGAPAGGGGRGGGGGHR